MSRTLQRVIMGTMVGAAVLAIVFGALYQEEDRLGDARIVGAGSSSEAESAAADGSGAGDAGTGGAGGAGGTATADRGDDDEPDGQGAGGPIEAFLPRSGEASACREEVGVDLIPGYGAELTINGVTIPPEDMNVNLDDDGEITDVITASRSLGHYTFQPDDDCPNGAYLRPVGNVLEVCVYRLSDPSRRCAVQRERVFDAL